MAAHYRDMVRSMQGKWTIAARNLMEFYRLSSLIVNEAFTLDLYRSFGDRRSYC